MSGVCFYGPKGITVTFSSVWRAEYEYAERYLLDFGAKIWHIKGKLDHHWNWNLIAFPTGPWNKWTHYQTCILPIIISTVLFLSETWYKPFELYSWSYGAVKQMDTLSDMCPSNNYIINGFVSFRNMIQALWTLFIKLRGRETNGHIIRHVSFQ